MRLPAVPLCHGWAIIQPGGPHWVRDFDEGAGQPVKETNQINQDWKLTNNRA